MNNQKVKRIFFVSTGRCGTTRLAEILKKHVPSNFTVIHQTQYSRRANILGNIFFHFSVAKKCCDWLFNKIIQKNLPAGHTLISTDPLISMVIPEIVINDPSTAIVHVIRDKNEFAQSMYNFTRKKKPSFIAHNFIPFWQPNLWPLENILSKNILSKYELIHLQKNIYFSKVYQKNPNYNCITMEDLFSQNILELLIHKYCNLNIWIPDTEFKKKANESVK